MTNMNQSQIAELAEKLSRGAISLDYFLREMARPATADLGDVQLDLDRSRRCGFPEVVFGEGKSLPTLERIFQRLLDDGADVLATRVAADSAAALLERFPAGRYNPIARTFRIPQERTNEKNCGLVAVVAAGTTDLPIAEEAAETARWTGATVSLVVDVGVAGPQRLAAHLEEIRRADAVVVVAGMEGALPSVVGGHVAVPVIAVPTSVGYGANFGGLAALLSMLNSCAANVTVVNIDAGFKAGYVAGLIASRAKSAQSPLQSES
jgi:NCAIR mutase (PurE)-related protein